MPLKWFRPHHQCSFPTTIEDDETILSSTTVVNPKGKWGKSDAQRSRRSHSHGPGLRALMGLAGPTMSMDLNAAATEEDQRRILYQTKTRRRFTVHGFSSHSKQKDLERSCSTAFSGPSQLTSTSLDRTHSSRNVHTRSPQLPPMSTPRPTSHPSIIFIDCPP
uniref:Uncharacterized protein n=1 Tax=Peronospora matthiolae TaxID=2874970 RepID=A0AAV1TIL7_9STRA